MYIYIYIYYVCALLAHTFISLFNNKLIIHCVLEQVVCSKTETCIHTLLLYLYVLTNVCLRQSLFTYIIIARYWCFGFLY